LIAPFAGGAYLLRPDRAREPGPGGITRYVASQPTVWIRPGVSRAERLRILARHAEGRAEQAAAKVIDVLVSDPRLAPPGRSGVASAVRRACGLAT
jgi:hypothetical protein